MKHKIVYSSDIHGNEIQYRKLVDYAVSTSADSVIIGGDIAPKGEPTSDSIQKLKKRGISQEAFIAWQRIFLEEKLPKLFSPLKENSTQVYMIMGNDDCSVNNDVFEQGEKLGLYKIIHGKRLKLTNDFDIAGYSYVPITPFGIKDWEKYDLSQVSSKQKTDYENRKRTNYRLEGVKSSKEGWSQFEFTKEMEKTDSIQNDLATGLFQENPPKTVYVIHCPPNDTNLDIILSGKHVGSMAVRNFIDENQPYLTLHGHIHETVSMSKNFRHNLGNTISLASGNHNVGKDLAVLVFDLYDLRNIKRLIL